MHCDEPLPWTSSGVRNMLSFLFFCALANLDFVLNSCHLLLPASSSFVALIFLALGFASPAFPSAASRLF